MKLYIDSSLDSFILISAGGNFLAGPDSEIFDFPGNEFLITLLPVFAGCDFFLPVSARITDGKIIGENSFFRIIDWGKDIIELIVDFPKYHRYSEPPALLETLFLRNGSGKENKVELYRDNGLRLNISDMHTERSYWLSNGTDGKMRLIDMGGEKLLIIISEEENCETLIAVNSSFEETARIKADRCSFDDGYFTSVTQLNTVLGHEKRERYEFISGMLKKLPDEIGFFTQKEQEPADAGETALALTQAVKLGREDEIKRFISDELYENFTLAELRGFLGEFDECRIAPWQIHESSTAESGCEEIVLGMLKNGIAAGFTFTVENSAVSNIAAG